MMNNDYIPDYSSFTIRELINVYPRIIKEDNREKVKKLKEQIHIRLNIPPSIDLDSKEIQEIFDKYSSTDKLNFKKRKINKELIGKRIKLYSDALLVISLVMFVLNEFYHQNIYANTAITSFFLFIASMFAYSLFTGKISARGWMVKESEHPIQFTFLQAMYFYLALIAILGFIYRYFFAK